MPDRWPYRFKPQRGATLAVIPALIILIALSIWQVQRHQWKAGLIAEREAGMAAPPMALPARIADPDSLAFRHVQVTGTLRHDKELFVAAVSRRGNDGYQIVTPLIRAAGPPVLVNRGWVPKDRKDPSRRLPGQVEGTVTIDGIARLRQVRSGLIPENQPGQNLWFTMDLPAMAAAAGLPEVAPVYVEAGPAPNPGIYPLGGQTRVSLPNDHLQYAATWFLLAIALGVIYVVYHRPKPTRPD
ncbi:surfeit locus 1 family protein [Stella humosa]|uniref:SURF1-like protein n=1 Tax=Stella humosa TaxID=94 RepID=A0A3N1LID7_9PROT|nr:SURF1 family protein [Stella humosa]ROP91112.1 surfeit locus 1 family protein [Stella humosa]BBK34536.1 SURF1-like protein [Stella humosa]